jgi:hypothetical protein
MNDRTLLFHRVGERLVDDVLQSLAASGSMARRVFVLGSDINLLGALDTCWKDQLTLHIVLLPATVADLSEAIDAILEQEQVDTNALVWIDGAAEAKLNHPTRGQLLCAGQLGAEGVVAALSILCDPPPPPSTTAGSPCDS